MDPRTVKKILVPTDFSEPSAQALQTAIDFAKVFGASIELVHVFVEPAYVLPPPVEMATFPFDMTEILTRLEISLEAQRDRIRQAGVAVEMKTLSGRAPPRIVAPAK